MTLKLKSPVYVRVMAIGMLFAMLHYVVGYRLMYSLGILYAKQQGKNCTIGKKNLKQITLSTAAYASLKWTEEGKEFSVNNDMYDVENIQKSGAEYVVTIYADNMETELITAFHQFENELFHPVQSSRSAKSAEDIMSAFQKDCTPAPAFKINIYRLTGLQYPVSIAQQYSMPVSDIIWHPPSNC